MQKPKLKSHMRVGAGKEGAKRLRAKGEVPAILYGHKREPISLSVSQKEIWHILHTATSEHMILSLDLEGSEEGSILTLVRDIQHHPVTGDVLHLDLQRISVDEKLHIGVPIELAGVAKGVKEEGGVLDHGIRELTINVKPMEIPEKVSIDISHLEIGQSIHVSDIMALYPDLEIIDDPHVTLAHISAPKKLEALIPEPGAAAAAAVAEEGEEAEGEEGSEGAEGEKGEGEGKGKEKEKDREKDKDREKEKKGKA
ncbi:MAG: 50S ribosomal protein L25 [Candidatus Krumholzibacteria bacterium]|nr:50S ribosomal protein L25 [Candidatus Krumholzibacteria bacterium]